MKKTIIVFGLLILTVFVGCTSSFKRTVSNGIEDRIDAEDFTGVFYDYQAAGSKEIVSLFSDVYLNVIGEDSLLALLQHKKAVLGNLKKDSLEQWETFNENGQRVTYSLTYSNEYDNGRVSEYFKLKKIPFGQIKIVDYSYQINN